MAFRRRVLDAWKHSIPWTGTLGASIGLCVALKGVDRAQSAKQSFTENVVETMGVGAIGMFYGAILGSFPWIGIPMVWYCMRISKD